MKSETKKPIVFAAVLLIIFGFLVSGCTNDYDELELKEFKFVQGEDNKDELEDGYEYDNGEEVLMYFEAEGFEAEDGIIDWTVFVTVMDKNGDVYPGLEKFMVENKTAEIDADWGLVEFNPDRMYIDPKVGPQEWEKGENEIQFEVIDNIGNKELTFTENFVVG